MRIVSRSAYLVPAAALMLGACGGGEQQTQAQPCQPCAPEQMVDASMVRQGDNALHSGTPQAQLVARGGELWDDMSLSGSGGVACSSCHVNNYGQMQASFAEPYPHQVAMAKQRAGLDEVTAAEMVQLCMVIPMGAQPLVWNSVELAALAAYVEDIQQGFDASMAPGANPCNPCAGNPCNPCGGR